jgi:hypothetical protein
MGTRKTAVVAALVSIAMMFSFVLAIGVLTTPMTSSPDSVTASTGTSAVAISAGGSPVGDSFTLEVGSSQGFSATSGGQSLASGDAQWSLAADGAAGLSVSDGDLVASVTALAPGDAGLYVSTASGVDYVNLSIVQAKSASAKLVSDIAVTTPSNGATVFVNVGASGIPMAMNSRVNDVADTFRVRYTYDETEQSFATSPPYAAVIPDITALTSFAIEAAASSYQQYSSDGEESFGVSDIVRFSVSEGDYDPDGDGWPNGPFGIPLGNNDVYLNIVEIDGKKRVVVVKPLRANAKGLLEELTGPTVLSASDPDDSSRIVSAVIPDGLIEAGESGLAVLEIANDLDALVDATATDAVVTTLPGDLVSNALYAELSILVSTDDGATFSALDNARLAGNPIQITNDGTGTTANENVGYFSFPSIVASDPFTVSADPAGTWTSTGFGTDVLTGSVSAPVESLSIFASFSTPGVLNIISVTNVDNASSLQGTSQDFATGGSTLEIVVTNVASGASLDVTIDGQAVTVDNQVTNVNEVLTVTAPRASTLASPAGSDGVAVTVEDTGGSGGSDIVPNGLTYVGPQISSIAPNIGQDLGGTSVTIAGEGFDSGLSADLGGSAISVTTTTATSISGTTTAGAPGLADLTVTLSNNYTGGLNDAYTFRPGAPTVSSATPDTVFDDGGYRTRVVGTGFLDPTTPFKQGVTVETNVNFSHERDVINASEDGGAAATNFLDDTRVDAITPLVDPSHTTKGLSASAALAKAAGTYSSVYVSTEVYRQEKQLESFFDVSNTIDFTFLSAAAANANYGIDSITPAQGPKSGLTEVVITGSGFPILETEVKASGAKQRSGHTVVLDAQIAETGGTNFEVPIWLDRGTDVGAGDPSPAAMSFRIEYNSAVASPVLINNAPFVSVSENLDFFYGKSIQTASPEDGVISVVVSGGSTEISTCDDAIPSNPLDTHDPNNCENPFLLGTLFFTINGSAEQQTALAITDLSMADSAAATIANANSENGQICVDVCPLPPEPGERLPSVRIFVGPNQVAEADGVAVIDSVKGTGVQTMTVTTPPAFETGDPLLDTLFPAAGSTYPVDVRIETLAGTLLAISRAESEYNQTPDADNAGYTYTAVEEVRIDTISPSATWLFGGQVATIDGGGFSATAKTVTVTIGGVEATPAPGFPQTAQQLNVLVPAYAAAMTEDSVAVDVVVTVTADTKTVGSDTSTGGFTYHRVATASETVDGATADVITNAFMFAPDAGGSFDITVNTDELKTGTASLQIPALPSDRVSVAGDTVFGVLRASKSATVAGGAAIDAVGTPIGNIWRFDMHLYDGAYPYPEITAFRYNTDESQVEIGFSVADTSPRLTDDDVATGGVTNWSVADGAYNYTFGATSYTASTSAPTFESLVNNTNVATKADVSSLTGVKLRTAAQVSFTVMAGAAPPESAVFAQLQEDDTVDTGDQIDINGANIAWATQVDFTPTTKGTAGQVIVTADDILNRGDDNELIQLLAPDTEGEYDVTVWVSVTAGTKGGAGTLVGFPAGVLTVEGGGGLGGGRNLLAALLALLGLLAGGDSGGGGGGPCFIATAAYGTPLAGEINVLRDVRDTFLLNSAAGTAFVDTYYRISPALADVVAQYPALATAIRLVLVPVVALGKLALALPHVTMVLAGLSLALMAVRRRAAKATKA